MTKLERPGWVCGCGEGWEPGEGVKPRYQDENERGDYGASAWRFNCGNCKESRSRLGGPDCEMLRCSVFAIDILSYDKACPAYEPRGRKMVEARRAGAEQGVLWEVQDA